MLKNDACMSYLHLLLQLMIYAQGTENISNIELKFNDGDHKSAAGHATIFLFASLDPMLFLIVLDFVYN